MIFEVKTSDQATNDLIKLKRSEPVSYKKAITLIRELAHHPTVGTGHPKPLGGDRVGQWSRRISDKHRLVYKIFEETVLVVVVQAYGHYDDK